LKNGCLCCSVKDVGLKAIENLMKKRGLFDYVLLETTGLAKPQQIAGMFWTDEQLGSSVILDGIVTLVDAKLGPRQLLHEAESLDQASLADVIVINKIDLVDESELKELKDSLQRLNPLAVIVSTERSQVDLDAILGIHAYELKKPIKLEQTLAESHLKDMETIALTMDKPLNADNFKLFMSEVTLSETQQVLRAKGLVSLAAYPQKTIVQSVCELWDTQVTDEPNDGTSKMVFIGRNLNTLHLKKQFLSTIEGSD
jgi:G3E family GTPase